MPDTEILSTHASMTDTLAARGRGYRKAPPPISSSSQQRPQHRKAAVVDKKKPTLVDVQGLNVTPPTSAVSAVVSKSVIGKVSADSRRASQVLLSGDEEGYQDALNQLKADALVPLIEDLSDWLNGTLGEGHLAWFYVDYFDSIDASTDVSVHS